MAGAHTHRRSLGARVPATGAPGTPPYVSPYPTNGLWAYYDVNFGRAKAVRESGDHATAWRQMAANTPVGDLAGTAYWEETANGPCLGFGSEGLRVAFPTALAMPYTLLAVVDFDNRSPAITGNNGLIIASGTRAPGDASTGLLLYTGYGGADYQLKYYAGSSYKEVNLLGAKVYGVSLRPDNTQLALNGDVQVDLSGGGTATLGSLALGDPRVKYRALLLYNRAMERAELGYLRELFRTEFNH